MRASFLIKASMQVMEYDPKGNFVSNSGVFDSCCRYGAYHHLIGDHESDTRAATELLAGMLDFIPFEFLGQVKLIYHPYNPGDKVQNESQPTLGWKYMPLIYS